MHPEFAELYAAHADNALPPDERQRLEAHLLGCPACQAEYQRFVALRHSLAAWGQRQSRWQPNVRGPTMARLNRQRGWTSRWPLARAAVLGLAAWLLVVGLGWWREIRDERLPGIGAPIPVEAHEAGSAFVLGMTGEAAERPRAMQLLRVDPVSGTIQATLELPRGAQLVPTINNAALAIVSNDPTTAQARRLTLVNRQTGQPQEDYVIPQGTPLALDGSTLYLGMAEATQGEAQLRLGRWHLEEDGAATALPAANADPLCPPADTVLAPDGQRLFWLCDGHGQTPDQLLALDTSSGAVMGRLTLPGSDPTDRDRPRAAIAPDGQTLFVRIPIVENSDPNQVGVAVIDLPTLTLRHLWPMPAAPAAHTLPWETSRAEAKAFGNGIVRLADGRLAIPADPRIAPRRLFVLEPETGALVQMTLPADIAHLAPGATHRWLMVLTRGRSALLLLDLAAQQTIAIHPVPLSSLTGIAETP